MIKERRFSLILLILFIALSMILTRGLKHDPHQIPSALINKKIPEFDLPDLQNSNRRITQQQWLGKPALVNVWASWCASCVEDHEMLMKIANDSNVVIYGLNYKDDLMDAQSWLSKYGNPYQLIARDREGKVAIDWGVYGTPETFVIDSHGIIKYKQIGVITLDIWQHKIKPLLLDQS